MHKINNTFLGALFILLNLYSPSIARGEIFESKTIDANVDETFDKNLFTRKNPFINSEDLDISIDKSINEFSLTEHRTFLNIDTIEKNFDEDFSSISQKQASDPRDSNISEGGITEQSQSIAKEQLPDFESLDMNRDGVVDRSEYENLEKFKQPENTTEDEKNNEEKKDSFNLSNFISLRQSFINTAGITTPSCVSFNDCGNSDPATFSYTLNNGEDSFNVDAAIGLKFASGDFAFRPNKDAHRYINLLIDPVIEADVSSSDAANNNSLKAAVPIILSLNDTQTLPPRVREKAEIPDREPKFFRQHNLIGVPKYEADQGFDTQIIGLDLLYTPTIPDIGIGSALRKGKIGFRWIPVIGFEFGQIITNQQALTTLPSATFVRATARLRAELGITSSLVFSTDYVARVDLTGNQDFNDFLDLSLNYFLDDQQKISVGLSYKNGETAPTFENSESLRAFFGLKF